MTPARPTVSVVVPVLDDAEHLRVCLALLAAQSRPALEVVVVDNGCMDDSAVLARAAGARVVHEPRRGVPAAAAAGLDAAVGELLVRCDADTRMPADWLERIVARFDADPGLDALTGPGTFHDQPGPRGRVRAALYTGAYRWGAGAAVAATPVWGSNCALRAEAWQAVRTRVHRERGDVHDDLDLSFQLALAGRRIRFDPDLRVEVAGRIFHSLRQRVRQGRMAVTTLQVNWARLSPGRRWLRRAARSRPRPHWGRGPDGQSRD